MASFSTTCVSTRFWEMRSRDTSGRRRPPASRGSASSLLPSSSDTSLANTTTALKPHRTNNYKASGVVSYRERSHRTFRATMIVAEGWDGFRRFQAVDQSLEVIYFQGAREESYALESNWKSDTIQSFIALPYLYIAPVLHACFLI